VVPTPCKAQKDVGLPFWRITWKQKTTRRIDDGHHEISAYRRNGGVCGGGLFSDVAAGVSANSAAGVLYRRL